MRKQRKFWTRERICTALQQFATEHGQIAARDYDAIAKAAGEGLGRGERPYPTGWTIRLEFGSLGEAFEAAGVEPPTGWKPRATRKPKRNKAAIDEVNRRLDAHVAEKPENYRVTVPCPDCARLRSERDELAWALRELVNSNESAIRLVRAGLAIATEAK